MKKLLILLFVSIVLMQTAYCDSSNKIGEIYVPAIKVKMPVYCSGDKSEQEVIDDEQSALYYTWQTAYRIVDHAFSEDYNNNQWNIQKIFPGAYAIITINDKRYFYECYLSGKTDYINDEEYFNNRLIIPCSSYDIMLSCCAENSNHHFIAVFKRLSEF